MGLTHCRRRQRFGFLQFLLLGGLSTQSSSAARVRLGSNFVEAKRASGTNATEAKAAVSLGANSTDQGPGPEVVGIVEAAVAAAPAARLVTLGATSRRARSDSNASASAAGVASASASAKPGADSAAEGGASISSDIKTIVGANASDVGAVSPHATALASLATSSAVGGLMSDNEFEAVCIGMVLFAGVGLMFITFAVKSEELVWRQKSGEALDDLLAKEEVDWDTEFMDEMKSMRSQKIMSLRTGRTGRTSVRFDPAAGLERPDDDVHNGMAQTSSHGSTMRWYRSQKSKPRAMSMGSRLSTIPSGAEYSVEDIDAPAVVISTASPGHAPTQPGAPMHRLHSVDEEGETRGEEEPHRR